MDARTILLVDDEEQLALAVKIRLQAKGYHVQTATDGQQALQQMEAQRPDLILLDIRMPVMDGFTCIREINSRYGRGAIPIIILTARDRMKDLFDVEGIEDYIVKPFDHGDLLLRIDRVFQRRSPDQPQAQPPQQTPDTRTV